MPPRQRSSGNLNYEHHYKHIQKINELSLLASIIVKPPSLRSRHGRTKWIPCRPHYTVSAIIWSPLPYKFLFNGIEIVCRADFNSTQFPTTQQMENCIVSREMHRQHYLLNSVSFSFCQCWDVALAHAIAAASNGGAIAFQQNRVCHRITRKREYLE